MPLKMLEEKNKNTGGILTGKNKKFLQMLESYAKITNAV
jgi:hypothetical protein